MSSEQLAARVSVLRLVVVIFVTRTMLNLGYRAVYPFLPFIASDLGVSAQSAASIIQSRNLIGLAAPLFGPLSDRYGRRTLMLTGLGVAVAACLTLSFFNSLWFAILAIGAISLGKAIFDPAQQAYQGDLIPYAQRGRSIALSELSWSAAALLGLPVFGIVVKYAGWRAGFVSLGFIGVLMLVVARFGLPANHRPRGLAEGRLWDRTFGQIIQQPMALGVLLAAALNAASNENVNVVFGQWMNGAFGLDAVGLGFVASAIGLAELAGELVTVAWVDRIGKHRLVQACLLASSAAYFLLPRISQNVALATLGLVLSFFFTETSIVAAIPLASEVVPSARASVLALNVAAFALGRAVGSFIGPAVLAAGGFGLNGTVSAIGGLLALAVWTGFVRERTGQ